MSRCFLTNALDFMEIGQKWVQNDRFFKQKIQWNIHDIKLESWLIFNFYSIFKIQCTSQFYFEN